MRKVLSSNGHHFGERADVYHLGRKGYPPFILECIELETGGLGEAAVDVGCGTGVATRQLSGKWRMTGVDADARMLFMARHAQKTTPTTHFPIIYKHAHAGNLPLEAGSQRLVTSFGAFHWFATPKAVSEFKRVLVPGGVVCIAHQKSRSGDLFRVAWRSVLAGYLGKVPESHKDEIGYNARFVTQLFRDGGFVRKVKMRRIMHIERYTIPEAIARVQSMTYWKAIPGAKQEEAHEALHLAFKTLLVHGQGTIERQTDTWAILAKKPG